MQIMTISSARTNLFTIAQETIESHEPVIMTSKHGNVVLLSEEDFKAIQETLYLQSIPKLVEDLQTGRNEPKNKLGTREDLPWKQ
jgi:antitoxin YefM